MKRPSLLTGLVLAIGLAAPTTPAQQSPVLVHFQVTGPAPVADLLRILNTELTRVLEGSGKYQLISQAKLSDFLIMDPVENLAFCIKDPGCIADMASEAQAAQLVYGDAKLSFDGKKLLVHLVLVDVPGRKLAAEKFGQFDRNDELARRSGDLLRELLGLPQPGPRPMPVPVSAAPAGPEPGGPGAGRTPPAAPPKVPKPKPGQGPAVSQPAPPQALQFWHNPLTWTAAGVGIASLATATALGVLSQNRQNEARQLAVDGDPLGAEGRFHEAEDMALGANLLFGLGGAALAAAVVLVVLDVTGEPAPATPALACAQDGCSAVISLRF